jgi:excisionase family DNA binding protein
MICPHMSEVTKQPQPELRGALQIVESSLYLGCSVMTVRRLVRRGLLKPNRATKRLLFPLKELDRFLESY